MIKIFNGITLGIYLKKEINLSFEYEFGNFENRKIINFNNEY